MLAAARQGYWTRPDQLILGFIMGACSVHIMANNMRRQAPSINPSWLPMASFGVDYYHRHAPDRDPHASPVFRTGLCIGGTAALLYEGYCSLMP